MIDDINGQLYWSIGLSLSSHYIMIYGLVVFFSKNIKMLDTIIFDGEQCYISRISVKNNLTISIADVNGNFYIPKKYLKDC